MLSVKKRRAAIVFKAFSSHTRSAAEPAQAWEPSLFQRSEKNTPTESWTLSASYHHQKYQTPLWSLTTLHCQSISWWKTPMKRTASTMKLCTISASEPWSSPHQLMATWTILCQPQWAVWQPVFDSLARYEKFRNNYSNANNWRQAKVSQR